MATETLDTQKSVLQLQYFTAIREHGRISALGIPQHI